MIQSLGSHCPSIDPTAFVAENATLVGKVSVGPGASVWYGAVLRADLAAIQVGAGSNIQDNCVLHLDEGMPCLVGEGVTVGHGAILHGCTIEDNCLIGMGAILLNGRSSAGIPWWGPGRSSPRTPSFRREFGTWVPG